MSRVSLAHGEQGARLDSFDDPALMPGLLHPMQGFHAEPSRGCKITLLAGDMAQVKQAPGLAAQIAGLTVEGKRLLDERSRRREIALLPQQIAQAVQVPGCSHPVADLTVDGKRLLQQGA